MHKMSQILPTIKTHLPIDRHPLRSLNQNKVLIITRLLPINLPPTLINPNPPPRPNQNPLTAKIKVNPHKNPKPQEIPLNKLI